LSAGPCVEPRADCTYQMSGLAPSLLQQDGGYLGRLHAPSKENVDKFAQQFQVDSAASWDAREFTDQFARGEFLCVQEDWQGALDAYEKAAHAAVSLKDRQKEARAVVGMADCLSKNQTVDDVLITGMYRHARDISMEIDDDDVFFRCAAGLGTLHRSLRRFPEAKRAWQAALSSVEASEDVERKLFARTQLALLLLETLNDVTVVNEDKDVVNDTDRHGDKNRACELLEAVVSELPASATVAQRVTAERNLARALRAAGSIANKKAAEQWLLKARGSLANLDEHKQLRAALEVELVDLYDSVPSLAEGDAEKEALIREWHDRQPAVSFKRAADSDSDACSGKCEGNGCSGACESNAVVDVASMNSDQRLAYEKALWAKEKLGRLSAQEFDSESD